METEESYKLHLEEISVGSLLYYQGKYIKSVCEISSECIVATDPLSISNVYKGGFIDCQNRVEDSLSEFSPIALNDDILGCLLNEFDEGVYSSFIEYCYYTITPSKDNWWELTWHYPFDIGKYTIPIVFLHQAQNHINSLLSVDDNYYDDCLLLDCWHELPRGYKDVLDALNEI